MTMFTRLVRSLSQSYRSRNVSSGGNGGRSQTLTRSSVYKSRYIKQADDKLGTLKHYFGSVAANKGRNGSELSSKLYISNINSILANPRIQRFFSSEAPKKEDDDNFHSNEMTETPKGNNQKSESKEESSTKDDDQLGLLLFFCILVIAFLPFIGLVLSLLLSSPFGEKNEIYFHEFENRFLKRGLVDHIVIINNSVAQVYVKNLQSTDGSVTKITSRQKYHIKIRQIESFEEELKEAQEALGIDSHVPVSYTFK